MMYPLRHGRSKPKVGRGGDSSCNALNLGADFFLLFPHQIRALPFPFPFSPR
jgi:hypothetical protein